MNTPTENGKQPAFPIDPYPELVTDINRGYPLGLTKREYFAAIILQGFVMYPEVSSTEGNKQEKVKRALSYADELLHQLNSPK